ncbi:MAG: hypothetical protein HY657_13445 [Acidobacteria bacterium]|nr:hypothetical protein [Acidobacteriota bacterium]
MELWVLIPISAFAAIAWVIHVIVDGFRRRQQLRLATEFHGKLLDRIGSAKEFGEFLNTTGGTKFLDSLTLEREGGGAQTRILRALQAGFVFLVLGIGLFILIGSTNLTFDDFPDRAQANLYRSDEEDGIALFATICTSIGAGLLISAAASYGLSKRLGLLDGGRGRDRHSAAPAQPV